MFFSFLFSLTALLSDSTYYYLRSVRCGSSPLKPKRKISSQEPARQSEWHPTFESGNSWWNPESTFRPGPFTRASPSLTPIRATACSGLTIGGQEKQWSSPNMACSPYLSISADQMKATGSLVTQQTALAFGDDDVRRDREPSDRTGFASFRCRSDGW
jgi:hypothetical protein